ncbi:MAG: hypothetical protein HY553_13490 [Elusimicrobia bacterium]|nr:hypothetical protein [Elusimicrobiota bacterium]
MTNLFFALAFLSLATDAGAFFDASITQTFGSNKYVGTRAWADVGDAFHVKPQFSVYKSDLSDGTYKTLQVRGAYDTKVWGVGVTGGGTPKTNGYSNRFAGVDATFSFTPGQGGKVRRIHDAPEEKGARGKGLARVDVGGSVFHTTHRDEFTLPAGTPRRGGGVRPTARAAAITIGQTDVSVNGGVSLFDLLLSADWTVSRYDKDLTAIAAAPAAATHLAGLNSIIQGFPKTNFTGRLDFGLLPVVEPYVALTRTTFYLGAEPATTATVGATAGFEILELHGSLESYKQAGSSRQTYVSFGAGVRF